MTVFNVHLERVFPFSTPGQAPDPDDIEHWTITIELLEGSTDGEWTISLNPSSIGATWRQTTYGPFTISGTSDTFDFQLPELAATYYGIACEAVIYYDGADGPASCGTTIPADPPEPTFTLSSGSVAVGDPVTITPTAHARQQTSLDGINWYEQDTNIIVPLEWLTVQNGSPSFWNVTSNPVTTSFTSSGTKTVTAFASQSYFTSYNSATGAASSAATFYIYHNEEITVTGGGGGGGSDVDFTWSPNPITSETQTVTFTDVSTYDDYGIAWIIGNEGVDLSWMNDPGSWTESEPDGYTVADIMYAFISAVGTVGGYQLVTMITIRNGVQLDPIQPLKIINALGITEESYPPPDLVDGRIFSLQFPREGFYDVVLFRFDDSEGPFTFQGLAYHRIEVGNYLGSRTVFFDGIIVTNAGSQFPTDGGGGNGGGGGTTPGVSPEIPPGYYKFWRAEDVYNNRNELCMKWLVCDAGATVTSTADGTGYRTCPLDDGDYERGWWSANRSDSNGVFTNPEWVQSEWTTPRLVNRLQLNLMYGYAPMDVVVVEYKDSDGNWIPVDTPGFGLAEDPEDYIWIHDLPSTIEIIGLRATVLATRDPNDWARLSELNAYYYVDVSPDVLTVDIREDTEFYESNVAIPRTSARSADISFNNIEGKFNAFDPYAGYNIGSNTRFSIYLSKFNNDTLQMEETYFGDFFSDSWTNDSSSMTASVQCRDASKFLQDQMTYWDKMWTDTSIDAVLTELLLMNDIPLKNIDIDSNGTIIKQVYLKQSTPWELFGELALVSFSMFKFTRDGMFIYDDLSSLNLTDIVLDPSTNVISASIETHVYANKITVKVNPFIEEKEKLISLWAAPTPTILSWSQLGSDINAEASTISISQAPRQAGANLSTYGWPDRGYLFLYELAYENRGGVPYPMVVNGEVVKYNARTDTAFTDIERGALYTAAQDWTQGTQIGQLVVFNMEFNNAPAEDIRFPFVTAIDVLSLPDVEATKQAHVVLWEHNSTSGRLGIANIAAYYTWLAGTGQTARDIDDIAHDVEIDFATSVAGVAMVQVNSETVTETINNPERTLANLVRRYGKNEIEIDSPFIQTRDAAEELLDKMIYAFRYPLTQWSAQTIAMLDLNLGDQVQFYEMDGLTGSLRYAVITGLEIRYDGGISQEIRVRSTID